MQLAPDEASIKAAKGLGLGKWPLLAYNDYALWGHCQGSGKNPYQTAIDLQNLAYKCSCPSRKFPCKHALALMMLSAEQPEQFQQAETVDWVLAWLEKRGQQQQAKQTKAEQPVDPKAQQKRQVQRQQRAEQGLKDLQLWLQDLLRNGLLQLKNYQYQAFQDMAKRMVDAQLPGIANQLLELCDHTTEPPSVLLHRLSQLNLLAESYARLEQLSPDWQAEIQARLGFPISKERVLENPAVTDSWTVVGLTVGKQEKLQTHCYWLYGAVRGEFAYLLDFIASGAPPQPPSALLGASYQGELCFYSGVENRRALVKAWEILPETALKPTALSLSESHAVLQKIYRNNPLVRQIPFTVNIAELVQQGEQLALSDGAHILLLQLNDRQKIKLLAYTEGKPFSLFGLFDVESQTARLLSVLVDGQLHFIEGEVS